MKKSSLKRLLFIVIIIVFNQVLKSQINNQYVSRETTFNMFREPSYISIAGGFGNIDNLVFEADIIPYYQVSLSNANKWGIELSPQVILRMYNQESFPVRTPSFMPRVTAYYHIQESVNKPIDLFGYFSWCHHSNGQENSFYKEDSLTINILSGNFATNMVETGVFMSRPDHRNPYAVRYTKLSVVYHYYHIHELDNRYGDLRFFVDFQTSANLSKSLRYFNLVKRDLPHRTSTLNIATKVGWIAGNMADIKSFDIKRLILKSSISFKPGIFKDVTLFAQYYYGQDYYNIHFERTLKVLRFGISAKPNFSG